MFIDYPFASPDLATRIASPAEASQLTWASKEKAWQHGKQGTW